MNPEQIQRASVALNRKGALERTIEKVKAEEWDEVLVGYTTSPKDKREYLSGNYFPDVSFLMKKEEILRMLTRQRDEYELELLKMGVQL